VASWQKNYGAQYRKRKAEEEKEENKQKGFFLKCIYAHSVS
jgi:hypothetical protein